jgi:large subunit ribosomal protein L6
MSRVGNKIIKVPDGVEVKFDGNVVTAKGKLGTQSVTIPLSVGHSFEDGTISFSRSSERPQNRADHGLARALVSNAIVGVSEGFKKVLELEGTGYKWDVRGREVVLTVGYSHPVNIALPEGINAEVKGGTMTITGPDKQLVGFVAARIFDKKRVEPYKGKGIKYQGQYVRRKAGKAGA